MIYITSETSYVQQYCAIIHFWEKDYLKYIGSVKLNQWRHHQWVESSFVGDGSRVILRNHMRFQWPGDWNDTTQALGSDMTAMAAISAVDWWWRDSLLNGVVGEIITSILSPEPAMAGSGAEHHWWQNSVNHWEYHAWELARSTFPVG